MTRPDLEALVRDFYGTSNSDPLGPLAALELARTVADAERARIVAILRKRSMEHGRNGTVWAVLADLADELEDET